MDKSLNEWLAGRDPDGSMYLFNGICKNWERIVGPETAELIKPLGRKKSTLILGAGDGGVIQEFSFLSDQILKMVNSFCGSVFFDNVSIELLKGRTPLDRELVKKPEIRTFIKKPKNIGGLTMKMDQDSPVARCYARYVELFRQGRTETPDTSFIDSK